MYNAHVKCTQYTSFRKRIQTVRYNIHIRVVLVDINVIAGIIIIITVVITLSCTNFSGLDNWSYI